MSPRQPYRPIGENPDPRETPPEETPPPAPLVHIPDDDPAHDASAAPDD